MEEKRYLTVEDLLSIPDAEETTKEVVLPNGKSVVVRAISLREHRTILEECRGLDGRFDETRWQVLLLYYGLKEPKLTMDQAQMIAQKPVGLVSNILGEILVVSGLADTGGISAGTVEQDEALFRE